MQAVCKALAALLRRPRALLCAVLGGSSSLFQPDLCNVTAVHAVLTCCRHSERQNASDSACCPASHVSWVLATFISVQRSCTVLYAVRVMAQRAQQQVADAWVCHSLILLTIVVKSHD